MLNASVVVQRAFARLRPARMNREQSTVHFHRRTGATRDVRVRPTVAADWNPAPEPVTAALVADPVRRSVASRVGPEAVLPVLVAGIVTLASVLSWLPGVPALGADGGTTGNVAAPRIAVGELRGEVAGARSDVEAPSQAALDAFGAAAAHRDELADLHPVEWSARVGRTKAQVPTALRAVAAIERADGAYEGVTPGPGMRRTDPDALAVARAPEPPEAVIGGPFLADGTLVKPIAVETTVADGRHLLRTYKVRKGDTIGRLADRFEVSLMTVLWANDLAPGEDLKPGRTLRIPPVNGVVLDVREGDTLEAIAKAYSVDADKIYTTNRLEDRTLVIGQTLVLPGAEGDAIDTEAPGYGTAKGGVGRIKVPARYAGGAFAWPVVGGDNYVSRGFIRGHYALDIAADYGSTVRAAAGGTVIFAGWKSNGGGYQVHIAHGSGLFTTYSHLSGLSVGAGQTVATGQQVGRVGTSGWATGPHLHFETWRGGIWTGGRRVNPLAYL